ncbi:molecular chaperone HscB, partial [Tremellales sp. Uapishka_1]
LGLSSPSSTPADISAELAQLPAYGYDLDVRDLRQKMLFRQKELHPDKYHGGRDVELAQALSGRINEAYEVLGDPLRRAEYIVSVLPLLFFLGACSAADWIIQLSLHEFGPEEADKLTDPMLLAAILEAREELDEAESRDQVESLRATNHEKVQATIQALHEAFSRQPPDFEGAKGLAVQLKYWVGLESAAKEWSPRQ